MQEMISSTEADTSSVIVEDPFDRVLESVAEGRPVVVIDDSDRENEGDIIVAAQFATPEIVAFMMREARGLICVAISTDAARRLNLPYQVSTNNSPFQTPFAVSVDHRDVVDEGVTAAARSETIRRMISEDARAEDLVVPGCVFPLIANDAGVLGRQGHTEGALDLARLAGLKPSGVLCEILNVDGTMARGSQLRAFAKKHDLPITSIQSIIDYRNRNETSVRLHSVEDVQTDYGEFVMHVFLDDAGNKEHFALVRGNIGELPASYVPPVRIHSECLTGDVFGSRRCDCGPQLDGAMRIIQEEGTGVLLYLRQEGRGIGLENKLRAYALQDQGRDTVEANIELGFQADERDFAVAAHMLQLLKVSKVRLITNNPNKSRSLEENGIEVSERIPMIVPSDPCNREYLETKREKLGHLL
jgi:3,4-dihydroxy 2-butanone 4-phosphate synthase/GTP cyclohydrolase II